MRRKPPRLLCQNRPGIATDAPATPAAPAGVFPVAPGELDFTGRVLYWRANAYRQWLMVPARSNVANVVAFPRPRPFRGAAARDDGARTSGNAALLTVAVLVVVGGVFLVDRIISIPRHIDCNFSKHRPCHSFVNAN
jgi:hypothetical protein